MLFSIIHVHYLDAGFAFVGEKIGMCDSMIKSLLLYAVVLKIEFVFLCVIEVRNVDF